MVEEATSHRVVGSAVDVAAVGGLLVEQGVVTGEDRQRQREWFVLQLEGGVRTDHIVVCLIARFTLVGVVGGQRGVTAHTQCQILLVPVLLVLDLRH